MTGRLFQCVWSSCAAEPLSTEAFALLAARIDRRHRLKGLTGALARDGRRYLGLLEGERAVVGEVFAALARDARHRAVRVLWDGMARTRVYPGAALAVTDLVADGAPAQCLAELLDSLPRDAHCPGDVRRALAAVRPRDVPDARVPVLGVR